MKRLRADGLTKVEDLLGQTITLHERLARFESVLPRLDARELVDAVLPFAHEAASLRERVLVDYYMGGARLSHGTSPAELSALVEAYASRAELRKGLDDWWSSVAEDRQTFRHCLELIIKSPKEARTGLTPVFEDAVRRICVVPILRWDGAKATIDLYLKASRSDAVWYYALMLLLDERNGFRKLLRGCGYSECGRYFLRSAESRAYCSTAHQLLGQMEKNAGRQKRMRMRARKAK